MRKLQTTGWRLVEAQHAVSTLKITDSLEEQALLEELLEMSKPAFPESCVHLDYLLKTPFRYDAPYPDGSRFRRAGMTKGVYYASEEVETAVAELAFYRLLFCAESPRTSAPAGAAEYTAFSVDLASENMIDLTLPPLDAREADWKNPVDYSACQALALEARDAGADLIRYFSVRDPKNRCNLAVLECSVFVSARPKERQTWRMRVTGTRVQAICEHPRLRLEFPITVFSHDARVRG